jgi:hypothetical protein
MAMIKTELCADANAEGMSPLSEYQFIDIKHEAVESVIKSEVTVRFAYVSQKS